MLSGKLPKQPQRHLARGSLAYDTRLNGVYLEVATPTQCRSPTRLSSSPTTTRRILTPSINASLNNIVCLFTDVMTRGAPRTRPGVLGCARGGRTGVATEALAGSAAAFVRWPTSITRVRLMVGNQMPTDRSRNDHEPGHLHSAGADEKRALTATIALPQIGAMLVPSFVRE
jgi:hypothetical protein